MADSEETLDEIEESLRRKYLLAEFLPYELKEKDKVEKEVPDIAAYISAPIYFRKSPVSW